ncbi:MAG: hypothetical protein ACXWWM_05690, partial [Candidatus Deferrimicrobiaceae bacterium]
GMAHNSAEKNPNFGKRETIDSSSSWKRKRWVDRENSIVSAGSLSSRRDFADNTTRRKTLLLFACYDGFFSAGDSLAGSGETIFPSMNRWSL